MKLSTVRLEGPASTPQIFWRISSRETGWPTRSCEQAEELDLVERELLDLRAARDRVRRHVDAGLADRERPPARSPRGARRGGRWRGGGR